MPIMFFILVILWLAAFVANLIHWHGSGSLYYRPESGGGRAIQFGIGLTAGLFVILTLVHSLPIRMLVMDILFGLLTIQHIGMILRRRRARAQTHDILSA